MKSSLNKFLMILYACLKLTENHDLAVLVSLALLLAIWPVFDSCKSKFILILLVVF